MRLAALFIALLLFTPAAPAAQPAKAGLGASTVVAAPVQGQKQAQSPAGIDFSKMPVEDAIQLMFSLISEDARKDMKDMLKDMNDDRLKKDALREAEKTLKEELKREREALKRRRIEERLARMKAEREAAERRQQARLERLRQRAEQERRREAAREARQRKIEEERRRRHAERVERARQRHAEQKGPQAPEGLTQKKPCPNPNIDCRQLGTLKNSTPTPAEPSRIPEPPPMPKIKHDTVKNSIGNVR
ncbi:MAG: hypothetical protein ACAH80_01335 [Alphaproteobacteria bacterium]